jgi:hypothetical protein
MKIYIMTYEERDAMGVREQRTAQIPAENLEQARAKARYGFGRKVIEVREETAEEPESHRTKRTDSTLNRD